MPRKKTSKRNARGILKKKSKYSNPMSKKIPSKQRSSTKQYIGTDLSDERRYKKLRKQIFDEKDKSNPDYDNIFKITDRMDDIYKERRAPFQSPEPSDPKSMYHPLTHRQWGEPSFRKKQRDPYITKVITRENRARDMLKPRISSKQPTRVTWGSNEERFPSPVIITTQTMTPQQTRTWGQFFGQKLGIGKGTKKQRKKKKKGKAKGKSKSKTKGKS